MEVSFRQDKIIYNDINICLHRLPRTSVRFWTPVIQKQESPNDDSSNGSLNDSTADATVATEVTIESSTDREPRSTSDNSVMTDATPLGFVTCKDSPVMTDATCTDSSVVTNVTPDMLKQPVKCLVPLKTPKYYVV